MLPDFALRALQRVADSDHALDLDPAARTTNSVAPDLWRKGEIAEELKEGSERAHDGAPVAAE